MKGLSAILIAVLVAGYAAYKAVVTAGLINRVIFALAALFMLWFVAALLFGRKSI